VRHAAQTAYVRIGYDAAALGLAAVLITGCGGSGGAPAAPVPETSASPASALPQRGGLVGAIDSARVVAVCENVRLYATTVEGGLTASADEAFDAILATLHQTPKDPALAALADRWQRLREHAGDTKTAERLTAFCSKY